MFRFPMGNNMDDEIAGRSRLRRRKWLVLVLVTVAGAGWKTRALISRIAVRRRPSNKIDESPATQSERSADQQHAGGPASGVTTVGGAMSAAIGTEPRFGGAPGSHGPESDEPSTSTAGERSASVGAALTSEAGVTRASEPSVAPSIVSTDPTTTGNVRDALAAADDATEAAGPASEGGRGERGPIPGYSNQESQTLPEDAPSRLDATPGWVRGDGSANCPASHPLKGNGSSRIFHRPGESSYAATVPEFCFATEDDATAAGFRPRAR